MIKHSPLTQLLKEINFADKEIEVYLTLLNYEALKVAELTRKVDIHRVSLYGVLDELIHKGVVSKYKKGGATYYSALSPKLLINYLQREQEDTQSQFEKKRQRVEALLPQLQSVQFYNTSKPKVQFYEGAKGMREAYEDTLTARQPIMAYANVETMHEGLPNFFPKYYKRRTAAKIGIRAILPINQLSVERAKQDQAELRQSKFFPPGITFSPEVNIYNNKVLIASWKEKMAIIIESREFADLQKEIYEQLWQSLPRANERA